MQVIFDAIDIFVVLPLVLTPPFVLLFLGFEDELAFGTTSFEWDADVCLFRVLSLLFFDAPPSAAADYYALTTRADLIFFELDDDMSSSSS